MKSRNMLAVAVAMILGFSALNAPAQKDPMVGGAAMYPTKNIVENAVNSKDHTTLVAAVKAAGLVDTLEGPGPFTVFAPTNEAFDKLPAGTVDTLLKPENLDQLKKILTYHVVAGKTDLEGHRQENQGRQRQGDADHGGRRHLDRNDAGRQAGSDRREGWNSNRDDCQCLPVERRDPRNRYGTDAVTRSSSSTSWF